MVTKNIVLLSDGTGNSAGKVWRTNVWRVFEGLDLSDPQQVACYDDGVGTSAFKPLAVLGGAFGWGLRRNVLTLYEFLCRNYQPGDRIYGFGFSRGAYTMRVVTGLALSQGIVKGDTDEELHRNARLAYSAYREKFKSRWRVEALCALDPSRLSAPVRRELRSGNRGQAGRRSNHVSRPLGYGRRLRHADR